MTLQSRIELIRLLTEELTESVSQYATMKSMPTVGTDGLERNSTRTANRKKIQYLREQLRLLSENL